jgi:hypothetical protein
MIAPHEHGALIMTNRYDASRALNELDLSREAGEWTDTLVLPVMAISSENDDTVPMLPALLRPQV